MVVKYEPNYFLKYVVYCTRLYRGTLMITLDAIIKHKHSFLQFAEFSVHIHLCHKYRLASAMDRLIRVSMKNAASCVIYHELQTLRVVKF